MSQAAYTRGSGLSGTAYRTADNDAKAAIVSSHKGSSRPSYALAGTIWVDDSANPIHTVYYYDGADDIALGVINVTTNVFIPTANNASVAEALTGTDTAKSVTPDALASVWEQGSDIASASSLSIPATGGGYFFVTGTTTITALNQGAALKTGREIELKFNGALTLTHNATSLILPGGANITTAAGDVASFRCEDAGNNYWRCTKYTKADGQALVSNSGFPKGYLGGSAPYYNNSASIIIPTGCRARSSDDSADIEAAGNLTVSLASSGANGLDTGSEASGTWYYVYLIKNPTYGTVAGLLSTTNEAASGSVTLPSGYTLKRQLPLAIRNDGSSDLIPFDIVGGWPYRPKVRHRAASSTNASGTTTAGVLNVLDDGTSATYASINAAALVPPISKVADLLLLNAGSLEGKYLRTDSSAANAMQVPNATAGPANNTYWPDFPLTASQTFEYQSTSGQPMSIDVMAFTVTEVN